VSLNGALLTSSSTSINFTEANGSLSFEVAAVPGYTANPSSGSVDVAGAAVFTTVAFAAGSTAPKNNATSPSEFLGLPLIEGYALVGGLVVLVVLIAVAAIVYYRRKMPPPNVTPSAPSPESGGSTPPP
jgi:hypothetical protein